MDRLEALRSRIQLLARCDRTRQVFGAAQHRHTLAPVATAEDVAAFETRFELSLPDDYRAWITQMGNGGAGPYYGLSALAPLERQTLPQHHVVIKGHDGEVLARAGTGPRAVPDAMSSTGRPFPLTKPWSPKDGPLPISPGTSPYDGAVHLAEIGCGYFAFLVVKGDKRGEVWADYTAGDGSIAREKEDFLSWVEDWADAALAEWADQDFPRIVADGRPVPEGALEAVAPILERDAARSPEWSPGHRRVGYLRVLQGRTDEALAAFDLAARHDKDEPEPRRHLDRARAFRKAGDTERALAEVKAGLAAEGAWYATKQSLEQEQRALEAPAGGGWAKQGPGWK